MTSAADRSQVTLATETIHNPNEPRHFMRIKPAGRRIRVLQAGKVLAESSNALRVIEAGRDIYDPVLYLPRADVQATLAAAAKEKTFCPIKGHASYFDLVSRDGSIERPEIAWCYEDTVGGAEQLKDHIAFYGTHVVIEEHPVGK